MKTRNTFAFVLAAALAVSFSAARADNLALGTNASASTDGANGNDTAVGYYAVASDANASAFGMGAGASGYNSTATGVASNAAGANSTAAGVGSHATGDNSTAVGTGASSSGLNSVALGQGTSDFGRINTVAVGDRSISQVAPGVQGTDAVNVDQLNAMDSKLSALIGHGVAQSNALSIAPVFGPSGVSVALGAGEYDGYSAVGVSVAKQFAVAGRGGYATVGVGLGGNDTSLKAGVAFGF